MSEQRPIFVVRVRAEPRVDPIKALRAFLKVALRRFGLRAVSVDREVKCLPGSSDPAIQNDGESHE
jgi:hypothetical protein